MQHDALSSVCVRLFFDEEGEEREEGKKGTCARVGRDKDAFTAFNVIDGLFLERIEFKGILEDRLSECVSSNTKKEGRKKPEWPSQGRDLKSLSLVT